jgi:COP9 signalosome complex subunit 1
MCVMQFIETGNGLANNYSEVMAPQDVGLYGGLCALASFDRTELKVFFCTGPSFICVHCKL